MSSKVRGAWRDAMGTAFLLASMLAASPHAAAADGPDGRETSHRPGEILVKLRRGVSEGRGRAMLRGEGGQKTDRFRRPRRLREAGIERWWHVKLAPGQDPRRVIERLSKHADVERAELNYELSMHATPSDPLFGQLWGLHNTGQTGGTADADIDAPEAWDVSTGSSAVVVAVVDSGIDYTHPDLAANMWVNPGEIPGNHVDDDGNGYVDDVHGYDFANDDGDPFDDNGHGTHVAGTIAADGDNGLGVVGVSRQSRLMALKFLTAGGSGNTGDAIRALLYAADMGAVVVNNSWGGGAFSQALLDAVRATDAAGALFVASAGNSNRDIDLVPSYPAAYDVENVLAVAATDHNDARAFFSNWGAARVHLAAPGVSILSTVPVSGSLGDPSGYRLLNGTSMAAPHVSGAAALLRSHFPTLDGRELKRRLMATAEPVASMAGLSVTGGRLNIANPLVPDEVAPAGVNDLAVTAAGLRRVELSWTAPGGDGSLGQATRYEVRYSTTPITEATFEASVRASLAPRPAPAGAVEALTVEGLEPATRYYFALKAFDQAGNASVLSNVAAADIRDEVVLYRDAFESGAPGWTIEGSDGNGGPALWHLSTQMAASPTHAFYYGREPQLTYWTGARNFGSLTSPAISLAGSSQCLLSFQHFLGNESREPYDRARVLVSSDDGVTWTPLWTRFLKTASVFEQVLVDLSSYDGQVIRLRFEFDTINHVSNWYQGWVVDDVVVLSAVAAGGNQPPIADAGGPYTGRRHLDVTFDGSGSTDPEGDPISYRWDFGDGAVSFGLSPTHAYQTTGTFDVRLVVNDGARNSAPSTITVTVTAPSPELVLHVTTDENGHGGVNIDPSNEACDNQAPFSSRDCYHYFEPGTVVTLTPVVGSTSVRWSGACSGTGPCQISMTGDKEVWANFEGPKSVSISLHTVDQGVGTVRMQAPDGTFDCSVTAGGVNGCSYLYPVGTVVTFTAIAGSTSYFQGWQDTEGCSGTGPCQFTVTGKGAHAPFLGPRPLTVDVYSSVGGVGTVNVVNPPSGSCSGVANSHNQCQFLIKPGATVTLAPAAEPGSRFLGWDGACNSLGTCQVTMPVTATPGPSLFAVFQGNRPPTARTGGPYSGVRQRAITFNGSASTDPDGNALTYEWTFGDGATATGVMPTHAYAALGTYVVTLTVRDGFGGVSSSSTTATIANRVPTARPGGPYSGVRGSAVTFNGAASTDPDGDALTYQWTFGDGGGATGISPTHTYWSAGTYTVTLRVRDAFGAIATASTTATVTQQ